MTCLNANLLSPAGIANANCIKSVFCTTKTFGGMGKSNQIFAKNAFLLVIFLKNLIQFRSPKMYHQQEKISIKIENSGLYLIFLKS